MLKQEWKSLFHNKILLLVVIVIALIPAIYAGLFLASMWDPYGNVDKLPVAIVNEDEPAEYGDTTLTVGEQLVDNLKENDSELRDEPGNQLHRFQIKRDGAR